MTIDGVADYLKMPRETIYKYARQGKLPAAKVGRHWRFEKRRLDQWIHESTICKTAAFRILVVDDDPGIGALFKSWLSGEQFQVVGVSDGQEALPLILNGDFDLVLLDLKMQGVSGIDILRQLEHIHCRSIIVIVTGYFDTAIMDEALQFGPCFVLKKPVIQKDLLKLIDFVATRKAR